MNYYTADTHFGHLNIIKYCSRPFANVDEMDSALIERWNSKVRPGDTVYHLGDFSLSKDMVRTQQIRDSLNGKIHLVMGNHDHKKTIQLGWESVSDIKIVHDYGNSALLCHYAMKIWNKSHQGVYHFFGHSHGTLKDPEKNSIDIGVDCFDYFPVSFDEIRNRMSTL